MHDAWIWRGAIIKELRKHFDDKYEYKVTFRNNKASIYLNNDNIVSVIMKETDEKYKFDFEIKVDNKNYFDLTENILNELVDIAKTALENG